MLTVKRRMRQTIIARRMRWTVACGSRMMPCRLAQRILQIGRSTPISSCKKRTHPFPPTQMPLESPLTVRWIVLHLRPKMRYRGFQVAFLMAPAQPKSVALLHHCAQIPTCRMRSKKSLQQRRRFIISCPMLIQKPVQMRCWQRDRGRLSRNTRTCFLSVIRRRCPWGISWQSSTLQMVIVIPP